MAAYGVTFGEKHSLRDWKLLLNERPKITPPEPKTNYIDVAGSDCGIDATESLTGDVKYDWAEIEFTFLTIKNRMQWSALYSEIMNSIHGKQMKIILDEDPAYFYFGRVTVNEWSSDEKHSTIVINAKVKPYKYDMFSSLEDWEWDPFDFETGVIREYKDLQVNGTLEVTVIGSRMPVVPIIKASTAMKVKFEGQTYNLSSGNNEIPEIEIFDGENLLTFTGTGTVSIDYRGGSL